MSTRTERHRADPIKSGGVVYTPRLLADFLADRAVSAFSGVPKTVMDPAAGDGALLAAVARRLGSDSSHLVGFDVDSAAIQTATDRLAAEGVAVEMRQCDFIESLAQQPELGQVLDTKPMLADIVIANPPYVRTQTLGQASSKALASRFGLAGRVDLYVAFAAGMVESLAPGGVLALLCSNKFLTNTAGQSLRQILMERTEIVEVWDLGDTKLFDAAVLPAIVIARKNQGTQKSAIFKSVYELRNPVGDPPEMDLFDALRIEPSPEVITVMGGKSFQIKSGHLNSAAVPKEPWTVLDDEAIRFQRAIKRSDSVRIADLVKVRVGIKTTADPVFIRDDWESLPPEIQPEAALLRPLLTQDVAAPWVAAPASKRILYTHIDVEGRAIPIELSEYPKAAAYLEIHREQLAGRKYVQEAGRNWFEIWVPQKPALWATPKVVFPDISDVPKFFVSTEDECVNGNCYWASCPDEDIALLIAAVGNSAIATRYYDLLCGNLLYAGRRRYMTQYVEKFPIPKPGSKSAIAVIEVAREQRVSASAEGAAEIERILSSELGLEETVG